MIPLSEVKKYYLKPGILEEIHRVGEEREVVPVYKAKFYGKRPSYMPYITDYKLAVSDGATSFHMSVERWKNVLDLEKAKDSKLALDELRTGWDLIFDIDAKEGKEGIKYAIITAEEIIKFLQEEGIKNIYVKFSGSRGFHIAVNGKGFPEKIMGKPTPQHYPDLLHKIVFYIKHKITPFATQRIQEELETSKSLDELVEIEGNWSYRHLFRAPYSLNEKTWLISLPLFFYQLKKFTLDMAEIKNFKGVRIKFLEKWEVDELELLSLEAIDFAETHEYEKEREAFLAKTILKKRKGEITS
ncbi:MAG: hypothetical protein GXN99_01515, partial [Candidatus Nanohaloarchaeota archaeon]|nr:hypothetical protein [Candidatus Nanohaloarchaeota archaeon]